MLQNAHVRKIDILAIGEILVDFIADSGQMPLAESRHFTVFPGGAVTNVCTNVSRLGGTALLVARVGEDAFGDFLRKYLQNIGLDTSYLYSTSVAPTTLVAVTRMLQMPDFVAYRNADRYLYPADLPIALIQDAFCIHTSAFALSYEPARTTILKFIAQARSAGCLVSFDPNYEPRIWEAGQDPLEVMKQVCSYATFVKPSLDDCIRLFGPGLTAENYSARFLDWGAQHVILTMGAKGALLVDSSGSSFFPVKPANVVDATGVGDSFWAGIVMAVRDGLSLADAIRFGQTVAEIKLQQTGPLLQHIDRFALYQGLTLVPLQESGT